MITDIVFSSSEFIMEIPRGITGGSMESLSFDGSNFTYTPPSVGGGGETSYIFIV